MPAASLVQVTTLGLGQSAAPGTDSNEILTAEFAPKPDPVAVIVSPCSPELGLKLREGPAGVLLGVGVIVGVGVLLGVWVNVGVSVLVGVAVFVGVGVLVGVDVLVGVGVNVGQPSVVWPPGTMLKLVDLLTNGCVPPPVWV